MTNEERTEGRAPVAPQDTPAAEDSERQMTLERVVDAPRELVWQAWTDERHAKFWWGPKGFEVVYLEMNVRPGGAWRKCMRGPDGREFWRNGVYQEVEELERLVFTYFTDDPNSRSDHETVVTLAFEEHDGKTKVTLHHQLFESAAAREAHQGGWTSALERLGEYVATGNGR